MKNLFAAALITSTFLTPVFAAELPFDSNVGEVTVYPRGAQVTRVALGEMMAGDPVVIVDDLPGKIVANSVRVEGKSGAAIEIGSVDVRQIFVKGEENASERKEIESAIEALNDEINALDQQSDNAKTQRAMLQALAGQAIVPRRGENGGIMISTEELSSLLALSEERFAALSQITQKASIRQREISKEIDEMHRRLSEIAPKQELKTVVAINLTSDGAGSAEFQIRYNVEQAGWAPLYDAKLTLGSDGKDSKVKITRRAAVSQSTTESWDNVALTLSTARPRGNTQSPQLEPYLLEEYQQFLAKRKRDARAMKPETMGNEAAATSLDGVGMSRAIQAEKVDFKPVTEEIAGFLAEYKISGAVSVANAGQEKNVTIGAKELDAKIAAFSVPKIDPNAYLTASFTIEGKAPWLPGIVTLSRDGVFLGKARLPLLNPGAEHSLGFGRDDLVKIERVQVTDKKGESGFISTVNVEERKFVTTITNLHDFAMAVTIQDQIPYGTHEDIKVEMTPGTTKPSVVDVDKKRGVLAWENMIEAGGEKVVGFGYKVSWPKEMNITPVE
ncbi:MAG: DUF4139 domain-containing protein [Rhizobiaceae bacterium]|nr:DUF4139 domain-containing protein [Rhizobiaceae bacterium]